MPYAMGRLKGKSDLINSSAAVSALEQLWERVRGCEALPRLTKHKGRRVIQILSRNNCQADHQAGRKSDLQLVPVAC